MCGEIKRRNASISVSDHVAYVLTIFFLAVMLLHMVGVANDYEAQRDRLMTASVEASADYNRRILSHQRRIWIDTRTGKEVK